MNMITSDKKDLDKLIRLPNALFADGFARVLIKDMPDSVLELFEANKDSIDANVIILKSEDDKPLAASYRNSGKNVLFVFSAKYRATSYFTSVSKEYTMPYAMVKRINNGKAW
jgi:hypothetical protein